MESKVEKSSKYKSFIKFLDEIKFDSSKTNKTQTILYALPNYFINNASYNYLLYKL